MWPISLRRSSAIKYYAVSCSTLSASVKPPLTIAWQNSFSKNSIDPRRPGSTKFTRLQSSYKLFSMGVPLKINLLSLLKYYVASLIYEFTFLIFYASSRIIWNHLIERNIAISCLTYSYDVRTTPFCFVEMLSKNRFLFS